MRLNVICSNVNCSPSPQYCWHMLQFLKLAVYGQMFSLGHSSYGLGVCRGKCPYKQTPVAVVIAAVVVHCSSRLVVLDIQCSNVMIQYGVAGV